METNDITAGTYLLVAPFWDQYLSRPGQPFDFKKHRRGAILELDVENARRLVLAKAVIPYDPDAPTHVVNADGSISKVPAADPAAAAGLVITEEQMAQLGIPADATSEDVVKAIQDLKVSINDAEVRATEAERLADAARQATPVVDPATPVDRPKSDAIKDILEWVGSDKEKATIALEGEKATKGGDKARPNLVGPLEEILTAPDGT